MIELLSVKPECLYEMTCTACGYRGKLFTVNGQKRDLCLTCGDDHARASVGWTPENSAD